MNNMCLCLDCYNKINNNHLTYKNVECNMDFCDCCNKNKPCVAYVKSEIDYTKTYNQKYANLIENIVGVKGIISVDITDIDSIHTGKIFVITLYVRTIDDYGSFNMENSSEVVFYMDTEEDIVYLLNNLTTHKMFQRYFNMTSNKNMIHCVTHFDKNNI